MMRRVWHHKPQARLDGVLLTPKVSGGMETIFGVQRDQALGPMVMFGLGGTPVGLSTISPSPPRR
jgi:acetate---CoA ligase (ADP-forming)